MKAIKSFIASCSSLFFSFSFYCLSNSSAFLFSSSNANYSSNLCCSSLSFLNLLSSLNCHSDSFDTAILELSASKKLCVSKFDARAVRYVTSPSLSKGAFIYARSPRFCNLGSFCYRGFFSGEISNYIFSSFLFWSGFQEPRTATENLETRMYHAKA